MTPLLDMPCNYFMGETCCPLPWKHDGDHQPADVVIVDRNLQPINGKRVKVLGREGAVRQAAHARSRDWRGKSTVALSWGEDEGGGGMSDHPVNRPAVKVDGKWLRRAPNLLVIP